MRLLSSGLATGIALAFTGIVHAAGPVPGCLPRVSTALTVRIGQEPPIAALLEGGIETPLSLFDAASGRLLWSAGLAPLAIQPFDGMDAGFAGSIAAIDLDADGLHDRIYAGDLAARLWRFDLQHGAASSGWAVGGVFADFSNTEGRSFIAAPDLSLISPPGAPTWLSITIGTAAPGNPAANNRLYALRDHAAFQAWDAKAYEDWQPLRESDLTRIQAITQEIQEAAEAAPDGPGPGWYVELGSGHVLAPTLTVHDRAVLVVAAAIPRDGAGCEILARIAQIDVKSGRVIRGDGDSPWQAALPRPVPAGERLIITGTAGPGMALCSLAGHRVDACDIDTRPRETWWRRDDAP